MTRQLQFAISFLFAAALLAAPPLRGQDSWSEYQRHLAERQKLDAERYEQWTRQRDQRYGEWQRPATDARRGVELADPLLKPGSYNIRLPWGLGDVRVDVPPPPAPAPGAPAQGWNPRVYGDVYNLARRMKGQIRDLHAELYLQGKSDWQAEAARIHQQGAEFEAAAVERRSSEELHKQFKDFDALWHPFSHRLSHSQDASATLRQLAAAVDRTESSLHQLLAIAPATPYDRVLVAALTNQLAEATSHLLEDIQLESSQDYVLHDIAASADRAKRRAAQLDAAVRRNAPFAAILEEYEEFDRAWHRLEDRAPAPRDLEDHLRRVARRVRQIDRQLHDALLVDVPLANDRHKATQLASALAKTAEHLSRDLTTEFGRSRSEVVDNGHALARAAHNLHEALAQSQDERLHADFWRQFVTAWNRLSASLKAAPPDRSEHSLQVISQMETDVKRLDRHFAALRTARAPG